MLAGAYLGSVGRGVNAQVGYAGRLDIQRAQLGVGQLGVGARNGLLVISPVPFLVVGRLIISGDGAHLVELRLEGEDEQAHNQQDGQGDEPDGLHVALVVTKVETNHEDHGDPTRDLHTRAADAGPTEACGWNIFGRNTVINLRYRLVGRHLLSFAIACVH